MKHAPASAVALFFDEVRNEANNKTSWMGFYVDGLTLLDPVQTPVDRIAVIVILHWKFGTEPRSIRVQVVTPFGLVEHQVLIPVPDPAKIRPAKLSPFAGIHLTLPMNLRLQPLAADMVIEAWLVVEADGDHPEERYPLGRLTVSGPSSQEVAAPKPGQRRTGKRKANPALA